jgi:cytoplasmic polyadenylation element-binding protein
MSTGLDIDDKFERNIEHKDRSESPSNNGSRQQVGHPLSYGFAPVNYLHQLQDVYPDTSFVSGIPCLQSDIRWLPTPGSMAVSYQPPDDVIDKAAHQHRTAAAHSEPRCTWSGQLPNRMHKSPTYSPKVFLGGVPWDITELGLAEAFAPFGSIRVQWPGRENQRAAPTNGSPTKPGYVYVIFEGDKHVKSLLQSCTHDFSAGGKWYFNISSKRMRCKEVQVIPWIIGDSNYVRCPSQRLDPSKTVFVGALHGMLTAEGLAHVMNDLFGGVAYVGIDTDKFKYPIGSGRVTFNNMRSYQKSVQAAFVDIKSARFTKKIQIDPYLENSVCSSCNIQQGPIFCRDSVCFRYFCRSCWKWTHSTDELSHHKPLMRNRRNE